MQEKLYIYTEDFFFWPRLKNVAKRLLGKTRGPEAVFYSLIKGLGELGVEYYINHRSPPKGAKLCVLSGVKTLKWAIGQKQIGKIKKIVAGPNVVVTPEDHGGLMSHSLIDRILLPSAWNRDWWIRLSSNLANKISIWPAGVEDRGELVNSNGYCLIFKKHAPAELFLRISSLLSSQQIECRVIEYGYFKPEEYSALLRGCKFMVYLTELESQGLALLQAWMANVPTLVWNQGFFNYRHYSWRDEKISAPYLTEASGSFFYSDKDFLEKLEIFLLNYQSFAPRDYAKKNFTNKICAQNYLRITHE